MFEKRKQKSKSIMSGNEKEMVFRYANDQGHYYAFDEEEESKMESHYYFN